ncbi:MAG TPA: FAD-dependent oxidoreductase [Acidimicrobiia bacterium]|nr:FAD-dependent oxidoreductase [Acidimicrobiia bacterium]
MTHVVILGAGFGGLELATTLDETLGADVEVTLIDRSDAFTVGFDKLAVLFGHKQPEDVRSYYRDLAASGVAFRQETVESIDPTTRRVVTDSSSYDADVLVVALGAALDVDATPGLAEVGHEFYSLPGAERLAGELAAFTAGTIVIGVLGLPYKCPPAPWEAALLLHDFLVRRGVRDAVTIRAISPAPAPLPISADGSAVIAEQFRANGIELLVGRKITALDPAARAAVLDDGEQVPFDLFMGVPVHRVPAVVAAAGLAEGGWVRVDPYSLETAHENVFAIGDVTTIPVGQGAIPKAGAFADRAARAVAQTIAARVRGTGTPGRFDGVGACYLEFGEGNIAKVAADYLSGPEPRVEFLGPSAEYVPDKEQFAATRLARWFRS